jgi:DNA (cytosine-5)-methyltransferase 1
MDSKIKFIDLFAGIGGMRLGFEKANAKCVLTCEISEKALTTYKKNFFDDEDHLYYKDILDLKNNTNFPKYDILVAGFPCQPYSIAGLRNGLRDDRGGKIFNAILKILEKTKPKAFLLENVKGLISHNNKKTYLYLRSSLEKIGYEVDQQILNTMDHGNCPQNRERLFIVGFREKKHLEIFKFPEKEPLSVTIDKCLEGKKVNDHYY